METKDIKVVTICGSMRFANEMQKIAYELETKKGYMVIKCVYKQGNNEESKQGIENIINAHLKKIDVCDMVYVVNINGYIGIQTQKEIDYALKKGKQVIYHEN